MASDKNKFKKKALLVLRNIVIVIVLQAMIYLLNWLQIDLSNNNDLLPLFSIILSFLCVIIPTLAAVLMFRVTPGYFALAPLIFLMLIPDWFYKDGTYLFFNISRSPFTINFGDNFRLIFAIILIAFIELFIATIVWLIRKLKKRHKEKTATNSTIAK